MEGSTDKILSTNLIELKNIEFDINQKSGLIIKHDGYNYEFIIKIVDFDEDIIVFSPNFSNGKNPNNKPFFYNLSWIDDLKCNVIYYNDPTLYDYKNLTGGWGIGTSKVWHLENIAEILKVLSKIISGNGKFNNNLPYSNLYFYGTHMAGYMSLILSVLIENSTSIVDEPYINLTSSEYWKTLKSDIIDNFSKDNNYAYRLNIIKLIQEKKTIPNSYMLFDVNSKNWDKQYKYFLNETNKFPTQYNKQDNIINIRFEDKSDKFNPLPKYDTINFINDVLIIQKRKQMFNSINLQMINEFYGKISGFYNDFLKKKISFERFNKLINVYYTTWTVCRIDIKNWGMDNNSIAVLNCDNKTRFESPGWFSDKNGKGIIFRSNSSSINVKFKCVNDGKLHFELRGPDYTLNDKREPIYVCYNKFKINDDLIFSKNFLAWHNLPYFYQKECKNDEIINIEAEFITLNNKFPYLKQLINNMNKEENIEESFNKFSDYVKFLEITYNPMDV